jgi:hypothetical protein
VEPGRARNPVPSTGGNPVWAGAIQNRVTRPTQGPQQLPWTGVVLRHENHTVRSGRNPRATPVHGTPPPWPGAYGGPPRLPPVTGQP